jgi:hypothetical protein
MSLDTLDRRGVEHLTEREAYLEARIEALTKRIEEQQHQIEQRDEVIDAMRKAGGKV